MRVVRPLLVEDLENCFWAEHDNVMINSNQYLCSKGVFGRRNLVDQRNQLLHAQNENLLNESVCDA